ncbi:MAG: hypothetical protein NTZ54_14795, partial [Alphaproteobacteria bacterium]|nr:hypothetical protein [Alphaproteobacteria bacterium]
MSLDADRDDAWRREAVLGNYAERPFHAPPGPIRIWSYCDQLSYAPGEAVRVSVCTNAKSYDVDIIRDGLTPVTVFSLSGLTGTWRDTPADCSLIGCGWPVSLEIPVAADWPSGGYILRTRANGDMHEHLFIVRPREGTTKRGRLLLIAATATWTAYNDWGGSNHYQGYWGPNGDRF